MNRNKGGNDIALNELAETFCSITSPALMRRFLSEIYTPAELRDTALRWRLLKLLRAGIPQREIAGKLNISLCKITRGSRILKDRGSATSRILEERYNEHFKTENFASGR